MILSQEADEVGEESIQDAFRISSQTQILKSISHHSSKLVCGAAEMKALCQAHCAWTDAAETRAMCITQHLHQLTSSQHTSSMFSALELQLNQEQDM